MNNIAKIASVITLCLVIIPCLLCFAGMIGLEAVKWTALVGTIGWFATAPFYIRRR